MHVFCQGRSAVQELIKTIAKKNMGYIKVYLIFYPKIGSTMTENKQLEGHQVK